MSPVHALHKKLADLDLRSYGLAQPYNICCFSVADQINVSQSYVSFSQSKLYCLCILQLVSYIQFTNFHFTQDHHFTLMMKYKPNLDLARRKNQSHTTAKMPAFIVFIAHRSVNLNMTNHSCTSHNWECFEQLCMLCKHVIADAG